MSTFVDHLFDALVRQHHGDIVQADARVVDVPPLSARATEAVEAASAAAQSRRLGASSGASAAAEEGEVWVNARD